ncbi:MAG: MFS transporter [Candidatus Marinimicrobia bacterium]|nr:MFS transporter [Candidatus Neomarinimicrobiota bacterium]
MCLIKDKQVFGWTMYDWANSAFATTIMAGFFPVFFKSYWSAGADVNQSTALLGLANSIASLVVALIAPILGAIADQSSGKKKFLIFFAYLGVLMTGCLFMVKFGQWLLAVILYVLGTIGFSGANIFYDSLLPDVTNEKNIDYVSAKGFALGYLGGGLLFLINVLWVLQPGLFGFRTEETALVTENLMKDARVIQVAEGADFKIPGGKSFGKAVITSKFSLPVLSLTPIESSISNDIWIEIEFPTGLNTKLLDKSVSFGEYKNGEIELKSSNLRKIKISNLTRKITEAGEVEFTISNPIQFRGFVDGMLTGVKGLESHFGTIHVKSDFLPPAVEFLAIRISFLSVALWWAVFTIPLILYVKERRNKKIIKAKVNYVKLGFGQLRHTFRKIKHMKVVFLFLLAYWLYIDGVDTIIRMAVDYGMSIGFHSNALIVALLITQFVGFPAALFFGKLGEKWDVKKSIFIAIVVYLCVTAYGVMMTKTIEFYILAIVIGLVQGGIQALSRSYYSRLIPKDQAAEFYGFYNMLGKFAAIFGPLIMGTIGLLVRRAGYSANIASRAGIASVSILFIIGGILLYFVDEEKGKREIEYLKLKDGELVAE